MPRTGFRVENGDAVPGRGGALRRTWIGVGGPGRVPPLLVEVAVEVQQRQCPQAVEAAGDLTGDAVQQLEGSRPQRQRETVEPGRAEQAEQQV
jgi:hypothetical protein